MEHIQDLNPIFTNISVGVVALLIGRFFTRFDKKDEKIEDLQDKGIDQLKKDFFDRFEKLEKTLLENKEVTQKNFESIRTEIGNLKSKQNSTSQEIAGNDKLYKQELHTIGEGIKAVNLTLSSITEIQIKTPTGRKRATV